MNVYNGDVKETERKLRYCVVGGLKNNCVDNCKEIGKLTFRALARALFAKANELRLVGCAWYYIAQWRYTIVDKMVK